MLGVATCPAGDDTMCLAGPGHMRDKWCLIKMRADVWLTCLKNGRLHSKYAWVSYHLQLWASPRYSLGVLMAPLEVLGKITKNFVFQALMLLGVNRNI